MDAPVDEDSSDDGRMSAADEQTDRFYPGLPAGEGGAKEEQDASLLV